MIGFALTLTAEISCANFAISTGYSRQVKMLSGLVVFHLLNRNPLRPPKAKVAVQNEYIGNKKRYDTQWLLPTLAYRFVFLTEPIPLHG